MSGFTAVLAAVGSSLLGLGSAMITADRLDPQDPLHSHQKFDPQCTNLQFLDAAQALKVQVTEHEGRMVIELDNHQKDTQRSLDQFVIDMNTHKGEVQKLYDDHSSTTSTSLRDHSSATSTSLQKMEGDIQDMDTEMNRRFELLTGGVDMDFAQNAADAGRERQTLSDRIDALVWSLKTLSDKHDALETKHNNLKGDYDLLYESHNSLIQYYNNLNGRHNTLSEDMTWVKETKIPDIESNYALVSDVYTRTQAINSFAQTSAVYTRTQASGLFYSKNWLNQKFTDFRTESDRAYAAKGTTTVTDVIEEVDIPEDDLDIVDEINYDDLLDDVDDTVNDVVEEVDDTVNNAVEDVGNFFKGFGRR